MKNKIESQNKRICTKHKNENNQTGLTVDDFFLAASS